MTDFDRNLERQRVRGDGPEPSTIDPREAQREFDREAQREPVR